MALPPSSCSPFTYDFTPPALPCLPHLLLCVFSTTSPSILSPSSVSIYSSAHTYTRHRHETKNLSIPLGFLFITLGCRGFKNFFYCADPRWHTYTVNFDFLDEIPIFTPGDRSQSLMSFFYSTASPLLCIHAAAQIQHIQDSGLWGILMEAVQSTTYCPVCLKCSTSQTALRPLKEWKQVLLHHHHFTQVFQSLTSILTLSSPISITFSLINHTPTPSPFAAPPFLFPSPERKNKQLSGSGLQMNSKWLWRAEGPTNFLQRSGQIQTQRARAGIK